MTKTSDTAPQVAAWMAEKLRLEGEIYQDDIAPEISSCFGGDYTYENELGNLAISKDVLAEFRKLTGDKVIWERGRRLWRFREQGDEPGRMQR
jgi:hypothetical protein